MKNSNNLATQEQISNSKMNLRDQPRVKPKKIIQYDEEQEDKLIQNKSKRWWTRVNRRYFPVLTEEEVHKHKHALQEKQLMLPHQPTKPKIPSFFTAHIYSKEPRLFDKKGIRVLFKKQTQSAQTTQNQKYCAINYLFNLSQEQALKNIKTQILTQKILLDEEETLSIKPLNLVNKQLNEQIQMKHQQFMQLGLSMNKVTTNVQFITDILNYQVERFLPNGQNQMENQVNLWEKQLLKVTDQTSQIWNRMFYRFRVIEAQEDQDFISNQIREGLDLQLMMNQMFKFLSWKDVLLNFKKGYSDKTQDMLAQALQIMYIKQNMQNMHHQKKLRKHNQKVLMNKCQLNGLFQTDCKICFSTYSSQKNRVVYCDKCNDSFHEGCYGIEELDKTLQFICDSCQFLKFCGGNTNIHKLKTTCAICSVPQFPTKNIKGNFYHPACLFLNNIIEHKSGQIQLRDQFYHEKILETVCQNQIQMGPCQYCMQTANRGLRVQCSYQGCTKYYHHLCAYLNAGMFDIWRHDQSLQVKVSCHQHYQDRDFYRQAYLRRFFCNFNKTSNLSEQEFIQIYDEQLMEIRQFKTGYSPLSLMKMTKIIGDYKESHLKKRMKQKQDKKKHKHKEHKHRHKHHSHSRDNKQDKSQQNHSLKIKILNEGDQNQQQKKLIYKNQHHDKYAQEKLKKRSKKRKNSVQKLYKIPSAITLNSNGETSINQSLRSSYHHQKQKERSQALSLYYEEVLSFNSKRYFNFNIHNQQIIIQNSQYETKQKSSDYSVIQLETIQSQCQKKMVPYQQNCQNCCL